MTPDVHARYHAMAPMMSPPPTVTMQVPVQVQPPGHVTPMMVLVLATEIQLAGRRAVENAVQVPPLEVVMELVMTIAILGNLPVIRADPCRIGPSETWSATVRSTTVQLRRTVGGGLAVSSDRMERQRFVGKTPRI
jgi:hypothetical protein